MALVLIQVKGGIDLPAEAALRVSLIPMQRHAETTFTIHETNDPGRFEHDPRRFLLIVPTRHIVTAGPLRRHSRLDERCDTDW